MATLHTQVVSELATSLEGPVRVATIVSSLLTVLVRGVTALDTEIVS